MLGYSVSTRFQRIYLLKSGEPYFLDHRTFSLSWIAMGASHSREGNLSDEEEIGARRRADHDDDDEDDHLGLGFKLRSLSLRDDEEDGSNEPPGAQKAKLYRHVGGNTPKARWVMAEKLVAWAFLRENGDADDDSEEEWFLRIGTQIRACVDERLQMRLTDAQRRADFVFDGVWAIKFTTLEQYKEFANEYLNCLFENTYGMESNEENRIKVFGKDFVGWARPQEADDSIWEDAQEDFGTGDAAQQQQMPGRGILSDVKETCTESVQEGIQSITLGGLDNSFLVGSSGVEAFRNTPTGLQKKRSSTIQFGEEDSKDRAVATTPKKGILLRSETQMMVMSPSKSSASSSVVRQLDLESGKTVSEWKFEKDGTPVSMKNLVNDSKGAQLDPSVSTFLGLDDNRLCRWDLRDKHGITTTVLEWTQGHQFARGTNFQCFAAAGDGSIAVGSKDGKVRLYGITSMRQAKTAFPGLGSPITSIDVTYDGKWVLATTDTYLILISTVFKDKDGRMKTGFAARMGNRIAAPRLLKLTPLDAHLAGKNQKFHGGQFSWVTESGKQENHLVVTVGNYTIIWNFKRVKQSNHECYKNTDGLKSCYCYTVVPKEESIVESKFMHDKFNAAATPEAPLIVATPKKLSSFNV